MALQLVKVESNDDYDYQKMSAGDKWSLDDCEGVVSE